MTVPSNQREYTRLEIQAELDSAKDQADRNRLGQFSTPTELALEILRYARERLDDVAEVRFIDPAIGTGSFFSALLRSFPPELVTRAVGYEIDRHYAEPAAKLWIDTSLELRPEDFTLAEPPSTDEQFNLLICNPPYVRHHYIDRKDKQRLKTILSETLGIKMSGLAGLYCYFLCVSHRWMAKGGLSGWLIPSEFMDVNYGSSVKRYLLDNVKLLHVHRFDPKEVQFGDALVSSAVVWFTKERAPLNHEVRMSYGGTLLNPKLERSVPIDSLRESAKWTHYPVKQGTSNFQSLTLSDFFDIKRGLATGKNRYFILSIDEIEDRSLPMKAFRPILPSPRFLTGTEIFADGSGNPKLERRLFLLDCDIPESEIKANLPVLHEYLEEGKAQGIADSYLCRRRSPWYSQENRPAAPFLCTYIGRGDRKNGRPFRFILNHSTASATNAYLLLYPRELLQHAIARCDKVKRLVWEFLNGIPTDDLLSEGRVYGGGLYKLEPKELGRVPATAITNLIADFEWPAAPKQRRLL